MILSLGIVAIVAVIGGAAWFMLSTKKQINDLYGPNDEYVKPTD